MKKRTAAATHARTQVGDAPRTRATLDDDDDDDDDVEPPTRAEPDPRSCCCDADACMDGMLAA